MPRLSLFALFLAAVAATPVRADTHETQLQNLARFQKYAGAPVESFAMWELYQWQGLGPEHVAVWAAVNKVYLLKLSQPCAHLEYANTIRVTSQMQHKVTRGFDYVDFDAQHCQIIEIRPIDYRALRHENREPAPAATS
jgi:hypothetical protein